MGLGCPIDACLRSGSDNCHPYNGRLLLRNPSDFAQRQTTYVKSKLGTFGVARLFNTPETYLHDVAPTKTRSRTKQRKYIMIPSLICISLACIGIYAWGDRTERAAEPALGGWEKRSGYVIVKKQLKRYRRGPFRWTSNLQVVYRLDLVDKNGRRLGAWACCGSYWGGVYEKPVIIKVMLDDPPEKVVEEPELA